MALHGAHKPVCFSFLKVIGFSELITTKMFDVYRESCFVCDKKIPKKLVFFKQWHLKKTRFKWSQRHLWHMCTKHMCERTRHWEICSAVHFSTFTDTKMKDSERNKHKLLTPGERADLHLGETHATDRTNSPIIHSKPSHQIISWIK